jgi:hypothetical protein
MENNLTTVKMLPTNSIRIISTPVEWNSLKRKYKIKESEISQMNK